MNFLPLQPLLLLFFLLALRLVRFYLFFLFLFCSSPLLSFFLFLYYYIFLSLIIFICASPTASAAVWRRGHADNCKDRQRRSERLLKSVEIRARLEEPSRRRWAGDVRDGNCEV